MAAEPTLEERDFFNGFDGTRGRPDNTMYLDMQERIDGEKIRAKAEGREPNLDDLGALPAVQGTMLVVKERQVDNPYSNPTQFTDEDKEVDPVSTLEVETAPADKDVDLSLASQYANERLAQDQALVAAADSGDTETVAEDPVTGSDSETDDTEEPQTPTEESVQEEKPLY